MDRRVAKTRDRIYSAFAEALNEKEYQKITVEDILSKSGISRSTFYAHFKTKEEVLDSISASIFDHVFSHSLTVEQTHDFSKSSIFEYSHLITHIFYHLHDEKQLITAILSSAGKDRFLGAMRQRVLPVIDRMLIEGVIKNPSLPEELLRAKVTEDFIIIIVYWFGNGCTESPEKIKDYFFKLNT